MTAEKTAQGVADQGRAAFRLSQPTPLREKPQMSSRVLETLAAGSVVTVRSDAGSFLSVITAADILGYIADDTLSHLRTGRPKPACLLLMRRSAREVARR